MRCKTVFGVWGCYIERIQSTSERLCGELVAMFFDERIGRM